MFRADSTSNFAEDKLGFTLASEASLATIWAHILACGWGRFWSRDKIQDPLKWHKLRYRYLAMSGGFHMTFAYFAGDDTGILVRTVSTTSGYLSPVIFVTRRRKPLIQSSTGSRS